MLRTWFLLLALTGSALGQGSCRYDIALKNDGGFAKPIPNAAVRVCTAGATGTPCAPGASIFQDKALTVSLGSSGTFNADANGNYAYCVAPGTYVVQVSAAGFTTVTQQYTVSASDPVNPVTLSLGLAPITSGTRDVGFNRVVAPNTIKALTALSGTVFGLPRIAGDPNTAGWGAPEAGNAWMNITSGIAKYWDGSAIQAMSGSSGGGSGDAINVKAAPYNCLGNGVTNDKGCIDAAITAACTAGGLGRVFFPLGTYTYFAGISTGPTPITVPSNCELFGQGQGSIIRRGNPSNGSNLTDVPLTKLLNVSNVTIHDLTFDGAKDLGATGIITGDLNYKTVANIYMQNVVNVKIYNTRQQHSFGQGIDGWGWTSVSILTNDFTDWVYGNYGAIFLRQYAATGGNPTRGVKIIGNRCDGSVSHSSCFKLFGGGFQPYTKVYGLDVSDNTIVVGDPKRASLTGASIVNGTPNLTCASCAFTAADTNFRILIQGAGAGGTDLYANIGVVIDPTHATLSVNALTTVVNQAWTVATGCSAIEVLGFNLLIPTWATNDAVFDIVEMGNTITGENPAGAAFPNILAFGIEVTGQNFTVVGNVIKDIHAYPIELPGAAHGIIADNIIQYGGNSTIDANCSPTPVCYPIPTEKILWSGNTVLTPAHLPGINGALYFYAVNQPDSRVDQIRVQNNYFDQPVRMSFVTGTISNIPDAHIIESNCGGVKCFNVTITGNTFNGAGNSAVTDQWAGFASDTILKPIITNNIFQNFKSITSSPLRLTGSVGAVTLFGNQFIDNYAVDADLVGIPIVADTGIDGHEVYRNETYPVGYQPVAPPATFLYDTGNVSIWFASPTTIGTKRASLGLCAAKVNGSAYPGCYQGYFLTMTTNDNDPLPGDQAVLRIIGMDQDNMNLVGPPGPTTEFLALSTQNYAVPGTLSSWRFGDYMQITVPVNDEFILKNATTAVAVAANQLGISAKTAGAANAGAAALPANPLGFLEWNCGGVICKIPYYAN